MELLIITGSSLLVNLLTEISKKYNWNPRLVVAVLSLLFGAAWYFYQNFASLPVQIDIQNFALGTAAGAVSINEFLLKHIK
jgi:hypothetical protein